MFHYSTIPTMLGLLCGAASFCGAWDSPSSSRSGGFLGVQVAPVQESDRTGVVIREIDPDGAAAKAGLRYGDVIQRVNGRKVDDPSDLRDLLQRQEPGDRVRLRIDRDGSEKTIPVTLREEQDDDQDANNDRSDTDSSSQSRYGRYARKGHETYLGVRLAALDDLSSRLRKQLNISEDEGLVVLNVFPQSPASKAGLRHGDVIIKIGKKEVEDLDQLNRVLSRCKPGERVVLMIEREGESKRMHVKLARRPQDFSTYQDEDAMDDNQDYGRSSYGRSGNSRGGRQMHTAFLGVETTPINELPSRTKQRLNINTDDGIVVMDVVSNSPAEKAGIRQGDVIKCFNDKDVDDQRDLQQCVNRAGPGRKVKLEVMRGGQKKDMEARLEEPPMNFTGVRPAGGFGETGYNYGAGDLDRMLQQGQGQVQRLQREIDRLRQRVKKLEEDQSGK